MFKLPKIKELDEIYYGKDPHLDAWILHFMTENNLDYLVNPVDNASREQLKFMVDLDEDQFFAPCSNKMLKKLLASESSDELRSEYRILWKRFTKLAWEMIQDTYNRKKIITLCKHKFHKSYKSPFIIPSRLLKRMLSILLSLAGIIDPYEERKRESSKKAFEFLNSINFRTMINNCPDISMWCSEISELRYFLDKIVLKRLFRLSIENELWEKGEVNITQNELDKCMPLNQLESIFDSTIDPRKYPNLKILYLPNNTGGLIIDLLIIKILIRMGHKIILALKDGFYFDYPTIWDFEKNPCLMEMVKDISTKIIEGRNISKKDFLHYLKENDLVIISDGTRERLNLYRTSVTFARAWKESDLIIAKGNGNFRRLIMTSHKFTRDVIAFYKDENNSEIKLSFKKKSPRIRKITEKEIISRAQRIIEQMRAARERGEKVMFYSAIVGSIPGQTKMAIKILNTFVNYLRKKLDKTFIINPAEYFIEGMDGDDLMYMWEIVQRSGFIDIWRFQTFADIEKSFELMGMKVPPVWAGKDATFSTGCTQEMKIALEEQKKHPEMQIIGPDPEKFFRRKGYGVGKYYDQVIENISIR